MLLRRLYSSAHSPCTRGAICNTAASLSPLPARPPTRGRIKVKPTRLSTIARSKLVKSTANAAYARPAPVEGRGRRRSKVSQNQDETIVSDSNRERMTVDPSHLSLLSSDFDAGMEAEADHSHTSTAPLSTGPSAPRLTFTHPTPSIDHVNTFRPVYLYPEQFKLHTTFTHPSHPLPLNLGTGIYTIPRKSPSTPIEGDIFSAPPPPDPSPALRRAVKGSSGLNDHFRVISNLSHPRLSHNLGGYQPQPFLTTAGMGMGEMEYGSLAGTLGNKVAEMKEQSEQDWQAVLSQLEGKSTRSSSQQENTLTENAQSADANLREVVDDLTSVLSSLGLSSARGRNSSNSASAQGVEVMMADDEVVWMDSVKRKRKKKISKHKYKKRRKATRALRKRLGK